jgi:hypothetical protein
MAAIVEVKPDDLTARRAALLAEVGLSETELRARADAHSATPEEWDAWTELQTIRFLLGEDA